jgi:hypothetical protein
MKWLVHLGFTTAAGHRKMPTAYPRRERRLDGTEMRSVDCIVSLLLAREKSPESHPNAESFELVGNFRHLPESAVRKVPGFVPIEPCMANDRVAEVVVGQDCILSGQVTNLPYGETRVVHSPCKGQ